ncbi:MAG: hypothetical protein V7727_16945 [Sneathiella sp.]
MSNLQKNMQDCFDLLNDEIYPEENRVSRNFRKSSTENIIYFYCAFIMQLQKTVGCPVSVFKYKPIDGQYWEIFLEFEFEPSGRFAVGLANKLLGLLTGKPNNEDVQKELPKIIGEIISEFRKQYHNSAPCMEVRSILLAAEKREIPWRKMPGSWQYFQFGFGKFQKVLTESLLDVESHISVKITNDKAYTSTLLAEVGLPVARFLKVTSFEKAAFFAKKIGYPVVVKPLQGTQGYGVTPNVQNEDELRSAYKIASEIFPRALVEKHINGDDFRLLVLGGKYVGAIRRGVTVIEGDGTRSIDEIVAEVNLQPWRNRFHGNTKYHVRKIPEVKDCLKKQGYEWNSIPERGAEISLNNVPNISQGGTFETVWDDGIHPENIKMAERAAKTVGVKLAGVDYLTEDITKPFWETGGTICEVNANPAFDLMFDGLLEYRNELGRKAFELSYPKEVDVILPVICIISDNENIAQYICRQIEPVGFVVGYFSENSVTVDGAPILQQGDAAISVNSVLWNSAADVVVINETGDRIQRRGLEYTTCTHLLVEHMPEVGGKVNVHVLDMILATVSHNVLINRDNPELLSWAKTVDHNKIQLVARAELAELLVKELHSNFTKSGTVN